MGGAGQGDGHPPFKSTIAPTARDQLGLPPCKQLQPSTEVVKMRGPSAALRRHCQWIKELQSQVKADQQQATDGAQAKEDRINKMQEGFKKQRDAIKQIKKDRGTLIERH